MTRATRPSSSGTRDQLLRARAMSSGADTETAERLLSIRRIRPESTLPGPTSTNVRAPRSRSAMTACVKRTGAVSCCSRIGTMSRAPSSAAGDRREERHAPAPRTSSPRAPGRRRSAASAVSGLWKPPETLSLTDAARAGRLGGRHERRDAVERARSRRPGRGSCSWPPRRPSMLVAEALDLGVVETDDRGHGARRGRGRRGGREAALAREVRRRAVVDRAGGGERGVLADGVADHVVGREPGARQHRARQASSVVDEGRLRDVGLAQPLDRALEAEPRRGRTRRASAARS